MNIVYGVSGEGMGHVFEALEIAPLLRRDGHSVKMLTYGDRACRALANFRPTRIEGLPLYFGPRGLSLTRTLVKNRHFLPFYLRHGRRLRAEVAAFQPEVFLTAYEPFTTHLAHALRKPLISMDNQNELLHVPQPPEAPAFDYFLARWATRACTHGAARYIVKSFRRVPQAGERVHFVAPLIQHEIRHLHPADGSHVLVYLTKPNPGLIEVLKEVGQTFRVYGAYPSGTDRNIHYRRSGPDYLADLSRCKAVVATTGFSLIADSIYLGKPYFGVPLRKQFEQTNNAYFLRSAGVGEFSENPSRDDLERFFAQLPRYRRGIERLRFDPSEQEETLRRLLDDLGPESRPAASRITAACR